MNDLARRVIMDRQRRAQDYARREQGSDSADYARRAMDYARRAMDYAREDYARRNMDMRLSDEIGTEPEYPHETRRDGKQGVKGTGPYGIGGRLYSRGRDYGYDDEDYEMDGAHPSGLMRLKKKDYMDWEKNLINADGSRGKHFEAHQIKKVAEQLGINYDGYTEKELCMAANMLYSDYCEVIKQIRPDLTPEKEVIAYTKMAKAFLEDEDSPVEGSEKLALYYWCIVDNEE